MRLSRVKQRPLSTHSGRLVLAESAGLYVHGSTGQAILGAPGMGIYILIWTVLLAFALRPSPKALYADHQRVRVVAVDAIAAEPALKF